VDWRRSRAARNFTFKSLDVLRSDQRVRIVVQIFFGAERTILEQHDENWRVPLAPSSIGSIVIIDGAHGDR